MVRKALRIHPPKPDFSEPPGEFLASEDGRFFLAFYDTRPRWSYDSVPRFDYGFASANTGLFFFVFLFPF